LLEYNANEKTLFETKIESRIFELGLSLNDKNENKISNNDTDNDKIERHNKIMKTLSSLYGDEIEVDISKLQGVRFHLNPKGPKPVEILLQRMFSQEFDITQEDILTN
jgi:hypothetical protein